MSRPRIPVLALIAGREHDYETTVKPLLHSLELTHHVDLDTASELPASLAEAAVLIAASDVPLDAAQAERVREFVSRGGGLVLLHGTLASWSELAAICEMAGWRPSGPGPLTELVLRFAPDHAVTERLPAEIRVQDELYLSEGPPAGADVLVRTSWRFTDQVVAYARTHGEGRCAFIGLGHTAAAYAQPDLQRLVHRVVLSAAGVQPQAATGVGLLGYGAIARLHAESISATPRLVLRGVCDLSAERRSAAERELSVPTYASLQDMIRGSEVDLVVVGTPPSAHAAPVVEALSAGKHVVCEKPFAIHVDEVDRMMDAAAAHERVLTVFQSRRWDPDYLALRDTIRSGSIGDLFYMESFIGGYSHPCDYWHSHEPISGGTIYDWGSHYFDWMLQLFEGPVTSVSAIGHKRVWHDVTNADQVRVDVTFAGGEQASFMQSDIAAALKPKWYALGTRGAVLGEWQDVEPPADFPARISVLRPAAGGGTHSERLALAARDDDGFYRNLADHLAWDEPLAVRPQEARRTVALMEAATESIALGGARLETDL